MAASIPVCLDINYDGEIGDFSPDAEIVIKTKAKAMRKPEDETQS